MTIALTMPELLEQAGYRLTLLLDKIEELHGMNQEAVVKFMQEKIGAGSMPSLSRWKGDDRRVFSSPVRRKLEVLKGLGVNPEFLDDPKEPMLYDEALDADPDKARKVIESLQRQNLLLEKKVLALERKLFEMEKEKAKGK